MPKRPAWSNESVEVGGHRDVGPTPICGSPSPALVTSRSLSAWERGWVTESSDPRRVPITAVQTTGVADGAVPAWKNFDVQPGQHFGGRKAANYTRPFFQRKLAPLRGRHQSAEGPLYNQRVRPEFLAYRYY